MLMDYEDRIEIISQGGASFPRSQSDSSYLRNAGDSVFANEIEPDDSISRAEFFLDRREQLGDHRSYKPEPDLNGAFGGLLMTDVAAPNSIRVPRHLELFARRYSPDRQRKFIARTVAVYFIVIVTVSIALIAVTLLLSKSIDEMVENANTNKAYRKKDAIKYETNSKPNRPFNDTNVLDAIITAHNGTSNAIEPKENYTHSTGLHVDRTTQKPNG